VTEHYFSETPQSEMRTQQIEVELAGAPRQVTTASGVFSSEHLDRGTEILLRFLAAEASTHDGTAVNEVILDLGCGWGPIALSAALSRVDAQVWAVDINARARELTHRNAEALGLTNVMIADPESVPADIEFDELHSNPPIRVGKEALHGMLSQWLPRLRVGGSAHLVVAKHLGAESLQRWIGTTFPGFEVARSARDKGFHIITAMRES